MDAQEMRARGMNRPSISPNAGGGGEDIRKPTISSISSGTPGQTTATITWTTDLASDDQLFWGLTTAYGGATSPIMAFTYVTSHSVDITGLTAATEYNYKILTRRPGGAYSFSANNTFTTAV